jgi:translation initiation factor eIF-2B subunit epsilon
MEEWRQSIAPIPKEKLEELQHAVPDDDRSEDESNNPTLPDKDDSSDSLVEDDDHISKFEKEVITYM